MKFCIQSVFFLAFRGREPGQTKFEIDPVHHSNHDFVENF